MTVICLKYMNLASGAGDLNDGTIPSVYGLTPPVNYAPTGPNIANQLEGIDDALGAIVAGSLAKFGVVNPTGVVTPAFTGQTYINTANKTQWLSTDATNAGWRQQVNPAQTGAASPVGVITPRHYGDLYVQTGAGYIWVAYGTLNTEWINIALAEPILTGLVSPVGVVVPTFAGQRYLDTASGRVWLAHDITAASWHPVLRRTPDGGVGLAEGADNVDFGYVQAISASANYGGQVALSTTNNGHGSGPPYGVEADYAAIIGGVDHYISNMRGGIIVGGYGNRMEPVAAAVGGAILGGTSNRNDGTNSTIVGGQDNIIREGVTTSIAGGLLIIIQQPTCVALGEGLVAYTGGVGGIANSVLLGSGAIAYGKNNFNVSARTWNDRSIAIGDSSAHSVGRLALAIGNQDGVSLFNTEATGDSSVAIGSGAQAHGQHSFAHGRAALAGTVQTYVVTLANNGLDLDIVIAGADLTSRIGIGDVLTLYALSGGAHDPLVNPSVYVGLGVGNIAFAAGDTTITVLGFNIPAATAGRVAFPTQTDYSFVFGRNAIANTAAHFSFVFGDEAQVEGEQGLAFGYQSFGGLDNTSIAAIAIGRRAKAFNSYAIALGRDAQSRNAGEMVNAAFQFAGISWAQNRNIMLSRQIAAAGGLNLSMYTDDVDAGTEEINTFAGHHYAVFGTIQGVYSTGGTARTTAQWFVTFAAKNVAGVLTILGAPTLTLINNEDAVNITAPAIVASGSNIRIQVDQEASGTYGITWFANLQVSESGL